MSAKRENGFGCPELRSLDGLRFSRVQTLSMRESLNGEAPNTSMAVETSALIRRFGDFVAVDNLNLSVARGSFFGFLGPNGAGKSTTIKMFTRLVAPTSGRIRVLCRAPSTEPLEVECLLGVVPEELKL